MTNNDDVSNIWANSENSDVYIVSPFVLLNGSDVFVAFIQNSCLDSLVKTNLNFVNPRRNISFKNTKKYFAQYINVASHSYISLLFLFIFNLTEF